MIINPQNLRGIYVSFNTLFNQAFSEQKPTYEKVATVVPSTSDSETYAWLGDIPGMREWIGDREIQNLTGSDYTIKNKDFELTVGVDRNAIEDDKIGLYKPSIQMLGASAASHPDELVYALLASGFEGFFFRWSLKWFERPLMILGAVMLIVPGMVTDLVGIAIIVVEFVTEFMFKRSEKFVPVTVSQSTT